MSQENLDVVRAVFDAWNRRDFDAAVRDTHENVELHFIGGFADVMGTEWRGRESLRRFWRDWLDTIGGCLVWTFEGGRVARIDGYYDPRAALDAVGLSE